jgi:hypothetical protein
LVYEDCGENAHCLRRFSDIFKRYIRLERNFSVTALSLTVVLEILEDRSIKDLALFTIKSNIPFPADVEVKSAAIKGLGYAFRGSKDLESLKKIWNVFENTNLHEILRSNALQALLFIHFGFDNSDIFRLPHRGLKLTLSDFNLAALEDQLYEIRRTIETE